MLSQLDNIIFPDRCEVLEVSSQRFVYPIFKNGSTSLAKSDFRLLNHTELASLNTVEIFVRDPIERFFSGLGTWLHLNQHLDRNTLVVLATDNLFLNRHYVPQFHWLVNLRRFTNAAIKINPIGDLSTITHLHANINNNKVTYDIKQFPKVAFYMQIDKVLTETLIGQTVEFSEIVETIKKMHPEVYQEVIQRSIDICNVLD